MFDLFQEARRPLRGGRVEPRESEDSISQTQGSRSKNVCVRDDLVLFHARDVSVVSEGPPGLRAA
jgi:hypothetical protein